VVLVQRATAGGRTSLRSPGREPVVALRRTFEGGSDDERYARAVLHRVRVEIALDRGDPAVADRLEAEFRKHLAGGPLRLPTPADAGVVTAV
jgi:hypothetical protein